MFRPSSGSGAIAGAKIPRSLNQVLAVLLVGSNLFALLIVPLWLLPHSAWWQLTLLVVALTTNPIWSLAHEGIHGTLQPGQAANRRMGRLLSVVLGGSFDVFRVVHLLHHKHNRTSRERVEVYGARGRTRFGDQFAYYYGLLIGAYVSQFIGLLLLLCLPQRVLAKASGRMNPHGYDVAAVRAMLRPRTLRDIRFDTIAVASLYAGALYLYRDALAGLLLALVARAFFLSFFNYVYHYATKLDDVLHGDNLYLPPLLSKWLLHFNYHGVHHAQPSLPWTVLPAAFREFGARFERNFGAAAIEQLRGPLEATTLRTSAALNLKPAAIE